MSIGDSLESNRRMENKGHTSAHRPGPASDGRGLESLFLRQPYPCSPTEAPKSVCNLVYTYVLRAECCTALLASPF
jgi:hypothetical protein